MQTVFLFIQQGFEGVGVQPETGGHVELMQQPLLGVGALAGFLASLQKAGKLNKAAVSYLDETSLRNAVAYAARAAAVTVSRAGANPPWLHELQT